MATAATLAVEQTPARGSLPTPPNTPQKPAQNVISSDANAVHLHRARIDRVLRTLSDFRKTDETRAFLYQQNRHNKLYCETCSPKNREPGSCDRTCPLLRPCRYNLPPLDQKWIQEVHTDHQRLVRLMTEMKQYAYNAEPERVSNWEIVAEELRRWARSMLEVTAEEEWTWCLEIKKVEGMKEGWGFDGAWGKGPGIEKEEHIGPDEMSHGKRIC
ncbi:hypothetical protein FB567DRAFT_627792 [Paraphoma chrysanthemicola]|uniref:Uncharacterized protein n=1 Tax=Paraphoma chrysanthemicola TaxID=798071 RepID=A0A8K0R746_9PLEO|nr:hypothetical protein FB567DRAFT_627792 [Paraphoma chrysanthemicola]